MRTSPKAIGLALSVFAMALLALLGSAARTAAQTPIPPAAVLQPQPLIGRENYMQNCAPCHGQTGKGDGPSAAGLSVPPTVFADYKLMASLPLTELFNITKNGNMPRMMPPWKNRLNDQQIWDAVGYAWTLHTSAGEVAQGQAIYTTQCASCHGPDGKGQPPMLDLTDFSKTAVFSQNSWAQLLAKGRNTMPAFGEKLAEPEQRAVLEYVRSLSLGPASRGPLAKGTGVISGTVTNQTTGQPLANSTVELGIFDNTALLESRAATADPAGFYRFVELPTDPTLFYVARVTYGDAGASYSSEPAQFSMSQTALNLPIAVYETTTDGSGVGADRLHLIVEFDSNRAFVAELMVFSLSGNKAYIGDGTGVLRFTLPQGAEDLEISDGEVGGRYIPTANGFVDSLPLPPGKSARQVLYRYTIPYTRATLDLARTLPYAIANVNALIADVGAKITSDQFQDQSVRPTQNGNYISLLAQNVPANQTITLRFSDLPLGTASANPTTPDAATTTPSDRGLLLILIGVGGLLAAGLVALPLLRRRQAPVNAAISTDPDALVEALARLDIAFQAGELSETTYRDERLRLKAQLLDIMRKGSQT